MKRYCPHLPLPAYRYIPGKGAKDEHRQDLPKFEMKDFSREHWKESEVYLYGLDLYQHQYFYEAHEVWEELWKHVGPKSEIGKFLQARILMAGAELKKMMSETKPALRMQKRAEEILKELAHEGFCVE